MGHDGRIWQLLLATQGLLQFYYGEIWLAMVYGLWFTRERSKVRSLVRPPSKPRKNRGFLHNAAPHSAGNIVAIAKIDFQGLV
jgi:hypothetical protein